MAVAVWAHVPTADELLEARVSRGWKPTPSMLKDGDKVVGHAACVVTKTPNLIQKAVGSWIRDAGKKDQKRLLQFLEKRAASILQTMLRYTIEKLPPVVRQKFLDRRLC